MRTLGVLTTILLIVATCGLVALIIHSVPDIKRYMRIRNM
ncbi:DUF6893 family small protein [Nocardiopsis oceani]